MKKYLKIIKDYKKVHSHFNLSFEQKTFFSEIPVENVLHIMLPLQFESFESAIFFNDFVCYAHRGCNQTVIL